MTAHTKTRKDDSFVADPTAIPDCTTKIKETLADTGDAREVVQKRDNPGAPLPDATPQDWTNAQKKAEAAAQEKANQNRKLSIGNLSEKYKCTDPDCPNLSLTLKLDDLQKVYSRGYRINFPGLDSAQEKGWEAQYKATGTVEVKCGKVSTT